MGHKTHRTVMYRCPAEAIQVGRFISVMKMSDTDVCAHFGTKYPTAPLSFLRVDFNCGTKRKCFLLFFYRRDRVGSFLCSSVIEEVDFNLDANKSLSQEKSIQLNWNNRKSSFLCVGQKVEKANRTRRRE
jgi:hypothetical protein